MNIKIEEIQTVVSENPNEFDVAVNNLLKEGYTLVRRGPEQVGPSAWKLYAELVKLDEADMEPQEADPVTWQEAVEVLRETCETAKECGTACPAFAWCQKNIPGNNAPPCAWGRPEELDPAE